MRSDALHKELEGHQNDLYEVMMEIQSRYPEQEVEHWTTRLLPVKEPNAT